LALERAQDRAAGDFDTVATDKESIMGGSSRLRATMGVLGAVTASLVLAGTAAASGGGAVVEVQDACDPATFPVPETGPLCVRSDGNSGQRVTFGELFDRLAKDRAHGAWRFAPDKVKIRAGETVTARMGRGGEFHTFTEVPQFGPGCVPDLNALVFPHLDPSPAAICGGVDGSGIPIVVATAVTPPGQLPPGHTVTFDGLARGKHRFECLIHPWMQTTVTVE
jgi:plastocyanin